MDKNKITKQDVVRVLNVIGIIASRLADLIDELANSKPQERSENNVKNERNGSHHKELQFAEGIGH
ncbi:hypothetical protein ACTQ5P_11470 [Bacillota bacterium LCP21S3_G6]